MKVKPIIRLLLILLMLNKLIQQWHPIVEADTEQGIFLLNSVGYMINFLIMVYIIFNLIQAIKEFKNKSLNTQYLRFYAIVFEIISIVFLTVLIVIWGQHFFYTSLLWGCVALIMTYLLVHDLIDLRQSRIQKQSSS